ncbi:AIR synthase family protein [candidate division KSB1 bacterium]
MESFPQAGKIHAKFFSDIIYPLCGAKREEVLIGPEYGVDVAVVRLPNGYAMASTTDPLSLIPTLGYRESAWLSVHLMASDITTTGCPPQYALFDLNLPPGITAEEFHEYWTHINDFCNEIGTAIIGGHTARFDGLNSTVVGGGTMITISPENEILTSKGGRPGDKIIVTRESAIISTAILACSFPRTIKNACGKETLQKGQELFYQSSTVSTALAAVKAGKGENGITAMHDVTEGGVCGALVELAAASDCGAEIRHDEIPVGEAQRAICGHFGLDPLFCIGAGSLIIAAVPEKADQVIRILESENISAAVVGELVEREKGTKILKDSAWETLEHPNVDPYWNAFFNAFNAEWK